MNELVESEEMEIVAPAELFEDCRIVYDQEEHEKIGKLADVFVTSIKDDIATTKKVISAEIAARNQELEQNTKLIDSIQKELCKTGYSQEQRLEMLKMVNECRRDSMQTNYSSREYIRTEAKQMHGYPKAVFIGLAGLVGVCFLIAVRDKVA